MRINLVRDHCIRPKPVGKDRGWLSSTKDGRRRTSGVLFHPLIILSLTLANADLGLADGHGYLVVPLEMKGASVSELEITLSAVSPVKCYSFVFDGKPLTQRTDVSAFLDPPKEIDGQKFAYLREGLFATVGPETECKQEDEQFRPSWRAVATYTITAPADTGPVELALLARTREYFVRMPAELMNNGLAVPIPFLANVRGTLDGERIKDISSKWLKTIQGDELYDYGDEPDAPQQIDQGNIAYTWNQAFRGGHSYKMVLEYEFEIDRWWYMLPENDVCAGRAMIDLEQSVMDGWPCIQRVLPTRPDTFHLLRQDLKPLEYWNAPPPRRITVKVEIPRLYKPIHVMPTWTPMRQDTSCVDRDHLYFFFRDELPKGDVSLYYMPIPSIPTKLDRLEYWIDWVSQQKFSTLRGWPKNPDRDEMDKGAGEVPENKNETRFTCGFLDQLKLDADTDLLDVLNQQACVGSCIGT